MEVRDLKLLIDKLIEDGKGDYRIFVNDLDGEYSVANKITDDGCDIYIQH